MAQVDWRQIEVDWRGNEFKRAFEAATLKSIRKASLELKKRLRADAPRSRKHRIKRTYPGGRIYVDFKRISQTMVHKAGRSGARIWGYVRSRVGYSVFVEHGKRSNARPWMRIGLAKFKPQMIEILKGNWPK